MASSRRSADRALSPWARKSLMFGRAAFVSQFELSKSRKTMTEVDGVDVDMNIELLRGRRSEKRRRGEEREEAVVLPFTTFQSHPHLIGGKPPLSFTQIQDLHHSSHVSNQ